MMTHEMAELLLKMPNLEMYVGVPTKDLREEPITGLDAVVLPYANFGKDLQVVLIYGKYYNRLSANG